MQKRANSQAFYITNKNDIVTKIEDILNSLPENTNTDVVIALDTTRSMWDDLAVLKSRLVPTLGRVFQGKTFRIGLVLYRDFEEEYVTKLFGFNDQIHALQKYINDAQSGGGGDWPEAVYEALDVAINDYTWVSENRIIFIIGDAPPHEPPNTAIDVDQLYDVASAKKIVIYPFIVPRRED